MELEPGPEALLDLSFLTEAERCAIAEVLHRDALLRRAEEGRVSKLRQSVSDPMRLRTLTGEWFCHVRAQRHPNLLGSDLVRVSIRRRRRPWGAAELERRLSQCELEAIREKVLEEKEDEEAVREESPSEDGALAATEPQPKATAQEGTTVSPSLQQGDVPAGGRDGCRQPGDVGLQGKSMGIQGKRGLPSSYIHSLLCWDPHPHGALAGDRTDGSPFGTSSVEEEEEEPSPAHSSPGVVQAAPSPFPPQSTERPPDGRTSPADSRAPPGAALSSSSSISSLNSSTLSGSLLSLYSDWELRRVPVRGCVQFSLRYEAAAQELRVHVVRCRHLAEAKRQRSDPYIKTYLLPDKSNRSKRKTSVRKRSLDPVFNETLKYNVRKAELRGRTLNVSVWHHDALGRNLFLGEVEVRLGEWDWANTQPEWFDLQPRTPIPPDSLPNRGHLNLALKFIPAGSEDLGQPPTGELHIWIKAAQDLVPLHGSTVDAFVQCSVLPDDSKAGRQKTRVVKRSLSPIFNHTMVYDGFQPHDLAQACAECTLWHRDAFAKRQLGGLRLSLGTGSSYGLPVGWMDSTAEERALWGRVLRDSGRWVEALLPLRTDLVPRSAP
ncbi:synaptotagmin-like protein 1 isoform X1 [Tympanuchus pallidicinctus]|uniref:synaptotagmin-like protein 1 isoform X1 n=1 Tax=Tympanuchus pallidicinctus TaxID=109042 RepID=UPI00228736C6|nr:synaptotagmin-like protein 1 isoform X1 [Tympanuchus pallidicinctus]